MVVRPKVNGLSRHFLEYLFRGGIDLSSVISGAAQPQITRKSLAPVEISFPPLPEQERIVAILDEAFAAIAAATANAEKNLANAVGLFDSLLASNLNHTATAKTSQTLSDITELIVDCEHKTAPTQEAGYPSIRTPNIGCGRLNLERVNQVSEDVYRAWTRRATPLSGDLILAREAPAGNVGVIPEGEMVCLGQRTVLIRPDSSKADSVFLAFLLLHPVLQDRLLAHSVGATVEHVNLRDIRALRLGPLPPLTEQREVARQLRGLQQSRDQLVELKSRKIAFLTELKQSILHKAFTGELTADKKAANLTLSEAGL